MTYFRKRRRFNARVRHVKGRRSKVKQGKVDHTRKMIDIELAVPLTGPMRKQLPEKYAKALDLEHVQQGDPILQNMKVKWSMTAGIKFFNPDDSNAKKPHVVKGFPVKGKKSLEMDNNFENDDTVQMHLTGFRIEDEKEVMMLKVSVYYDDDTWAWCGKNFDNQEIAVECEPMAKATEGEEAGLLEPDKSGEAGEGGEQEDNKDSNEP